MLQVFLVMLHARVSCNVTVTGNTCSIKRNTCNITRNICNITRSTSNISRNNCNITRNNATLHETRATLHASASAEYTKPLSAVHPVICNPLWVKCLFDLISLSDFGGKWPIKWKFSKNVFPDSSTGHQITFRDQIWWKSAVAKLLKGRVVHNIKRGLHRTRPSPHFPKMGRSRRKFPERCRPLSCLRIPNLVQIGCVLPDLFRKDWFSAQKSIALSLQKTAFV